MGHIPKKLRFDVLKRDGFRCLYCGRGPDDGAKLHVDHVVPRALGGTTALDNLKAACADCNHGKSDTPLVGPRKTRPRRPSLPTITLSNCNECPDLERWGTGPDPTQDWYGYDVCTHEAWSKERYGERGFRDRDAPDSPPAWCPRRARTRQKRAS